MTLLMISALMYKLQGMKGMQDLMRPYVWIINLLTLIWFISLQYFRFKDTGRACCGDFLVNMKKPGDYGAVYLPSQGQWIFVFVVAQYILFIIQRIIIIIITNRLESQFEE